MAVLVVDFLLIGDSKLKIVMSSDDMKEFKLDSASDCSSPGYRRVFWQVLDRAKCEVGFDTRGDKVLIQFYPLKSGGCEVFVTKLGVLPKESARIVSDSERVTLLSRSKSFYAFESFVDLKRFFASISARLSEPYPISDLYIADSNVYYLAIEECIKGGENIEFPEILEFARMLTADLEFYVTEHLGCVFCGDALKRIEDM